MKKIIAVKKPKALKASDLILLLDHARKESEVLRKYAKRCGDKIRAQRSNLRGLQKSLEGASGYRHKIMELEIQNDLLRGKIFVLQTPLVSKVESPTVQTPKRSFWKWGK